MGILTDKNRAFQIKAALSALLALVFVLGVIKFLQIRSAMRMAEMMGPKPEAVTTGRVAQASWKQEFSTVGTFIAAQGVTVSAEESGTLIRIGFESGSKVQAGQLLLEIDHSVEDANLAGALSRSELARRNLARAQSLKSQSALSMATLEDAQSKLQQAEAEVTSLRSVIQRKTIKAPFSGRTGIRMVNVGEYVAAGRSLVPLYSVNPLFFNFSLPQQMLPTLKLKSSIRVEVDAFSSVSFTGEVTAINPNVNEATRNVEIQATVDNSEEKLLPGMFGRVSLDLGSDTEILTIPASSVVYAPYGDFVYVVERKIEHRDAKESGAEVTTVRQQKVELGHRRGDLVSVVGGLSQGEEIVTTGGFKLRPGAQVVVNNQITAPSSENPRLQDS